MSPKKLFLSFFFLLALILFSPKPAYALCGTDLECLNRTYPTGTYVSDFFGDASVCDFTQVTSSVEGPDARLGGQCANEGCQEYRHNDDYSSLALICYSALASSCESQNRCDIGFASGTASVDGACLSPGNYTLSLEVVQRQGADAGRLIRTVNTTAFTKVSGTPVTASMTPGTVPIADVTNQQLLFAVRNASGEALCLAGGPEVENTVVESVPIPPFDYCGQVPGKNEPNSQYAQCQECIAKGGVDASGNPIGTLYTAVGCIHVEGESLAADLIRLFLGIAGGVALLSILAGAFLFTTSQGESNRVKEGKELITAAIAGLFFIIFSVIILDFIGVKILQIPGLG